MNSQSQTRWIIRNPEPSDFAGIQGLCRKVYPFSAPWNLEQLASHQQVFKEGQFLAVDRNSGQLLGLAFSLIVYWDDYSMFDSWKDFTDSGYFRNHDPESGKTLYGAEVMVAPDCRGQGIGKALYQTREDLVRRMKLLRIRAGARLRGYANYAETLSPREYVKRVINKEIYDPTLTFQLKRGYKVLSVAPNYLKNDPESLGYAAVIEWLNPETATPEDFTREAEQVRKLLESH